MLNYFYKNDFVRYQKDAPKNWQEAIRMSCITLVEKKLISNQYVDEIVECVEKYGPYIVIVPGVAMPHSSEKSEGIFGTGISFTKMPYPVEFEVGNPEKTTQLFFTLAAKNSEEHMGNIANLSDMLMTEGLIEALIKTTSLEEYEEVMPQFDL